MRGYLRLFFSVLLLSILVVLISRVLIAKKIDKGEIEKNLRSLILTHFDGTDVDLESFTYEIGSHLEIQIEKLAILDDSSREKLLGVEEVKLIVPIMTVLTSKGKIKSYIKRISYFSNTQKHLIKKINTTSQDKGYGKFPKFIEHSKIDLKVEKFEVNDILIGELKFKNLKFDNTSAFEIKNVYRSDEFTADYRAIGEFSLRDLLTLGHLKSQSSLYIENISSSRGQQFFKQIDFKGVIETSGAIDCLEGSIKLEQDGVVQLSSNFDILAQSILLDDIKAEINSSRFWNSSNTSNIIITGSAILNKSNFKVDSDLKLESSKPIDKNYFSNTISGTVNDDRFEINVRSEGLNGAIGTSAMGRLDLRNLFSENKVLSDIRLKIFSSSLDLDLVKFGDLFAESSLETLNSTLDFDAEISFSNWLLRDQVFEGSANLIHDGATLRIPSFVLFDGTGNMKGSLKKVIGSNDFNVAAELHKFEVDFLKGIMGNKDIHLTGKMSGHLGYKNSVLDLNLAGRDGDIEGLYSLLSIDDFLRSSKPTYTLDNAYKIVAINASMGFNKINIKEFLVQDTKNQNLRLSGDIFLIEGPSRIEAKFSSGESNTFFQLEGNSLSLNPISDLDNITTEE